MNSQFILWLYPLLMLGVVSLFIRIKMPWRWSWGFILQSLPIIAIAIIGLRFGPDWLCAIVGWILVILFYAPPAMFYMRLQQSLTGLDPDGIRGAFKYVRWLFWGMPGRFWADVTEALALYIEENRSEAEQLLERWMSNENVPKQIRKMPLTYRLVGDGVMWRWSSIIEQYENMAKQGPVSSAVLLPASRAFAELGDFERSRDCIVQARLPEGNHPLGNLATSLLPFFALSGSMSETGKLLDILSVNKRDFPEYTRLYWLGRAYAVSGNRDKASELLLQARELTTSQLFAKRIDRILGMLKEPRIEVSESDIDASRADETGTDPDFLAESDIEAGIEDGGSERTAGLAAEKLGSLRSDVWRIFREAAFVQELVSPKRKSPAVITIMVLIVIVYLFTDLPFLVTLLPGLPGSLAAYGAALHGTIFLKFALVPEMVLKGEYWRLITYLFLHAHITHAALNLIGLYWFGRVAENIFGTSRFLAIYLVGGLLSGVSHALLSPLPAVGASGAVMAVFGAVAAGIFRLKDKIPRSIWRLELSWLGGLMIAQCVLDQIIPHVAVFAHLGGLIAGMAIGSLLSIRAFIGEEVDGTQGFVSG